MSWFSDIFSSKVDKVVDSVTDGLDNLFTSDEEKLILANKKLEIENSLKLALKNFQLDLERIAVEREKEITKRWQSDNEHLITRLIRPLSYAWVIFVFTISMIGDGNWGFTVNSDYLPIIEALLTTMTLAYFGSRGLEKITKISAK
jgi:hypothetical protein